MKTIKDIEFGETCCGEHTFVAEYIREDGIGFMIKRSPQTGLYSIMVYARDNFTLLLSKVKVSEQEADSILLGTY